MIDLQELINLRGEIMAIDETVEWDEPIGDLPEGSRLLALDAADAARFLEEKLRKMVARLAERDGL